WSPDVVRTRQCAAAVPAGEARTGRRRRAEPVGPPLGSVPTFHQGPGARSSCFRTYSTACFFARWGVNDYDLAERLPEPSKPYVATVAPGAKGEALRYLTRGGGRGGCFSPQRRLL